MKLLSFINRYFSPLLLLLTIVVSVICYILKLPIDIWYLMEAYPTFYIVCYLIVLFFPLLFLVCSQMWKKTSDRYRKFLLFGLTGFLISTLYSIPISIYLAALFFISAIVYAIKQQKIYKPNWLFYPFIIYFLVHLVSLSWSNDRAYGWSRLAIYVYFVAFPVAFLFFRLSKKEITTVLFVFFRSTLVMSCVSICVWAFNTSRIDVPFVRWFYFQKGAIGKTLSSHYTLDWLGFDHPTFVMIGLCTAAIVALFIYFSDRKKAIRLVRWFDVVIFLAIATVVSLFTVSRIGMLILLGIISFAIIWRLYYGKKILVIIVFLIGIVTIFLAFMYLPKLRMISNDVERGRLYEIAFVEIEKTPFWGTGVGGMVKVIHAARTEDEVDRGVLINKHPHNQFVGDWLQTGLLGLLALFGMLISLFYLSARYRNGMLLAFLLMFLPNMLVDMPFIGFKGTVQFVPFVCLLLQQIYTDGQWKMKKNIGTK